MPGVILLAQETGIGVEHLNDVGIIDRQPKLVALHALN